MKAYIMTTGIVFGVITLAHIWRASVETHLVAEPWFILLTLAAGSLSLWAFWLLSRLRRSG